VSDIFHSERSERTKSVEVIAVSFSASVRDLEQRGDNHGRRRESTWETIGHRNRGEEQEWQIKKNGSAQIDTIECYIGLRPVCQILLLIGACGGTQRRRADRNDWRNSPR
jgi:hypothetical protein